MATCADCGGTGRTRYTVEHTRACRSDDPDVRSMTPTCQCDGCRDDEEPGCAMVMHDSSSGEPVQCGLPGGHEGSCDYWERPHGVVAVDDAGGTQVVEDW